MTSISETRRVDTTAPLTGGGALNQDRTFGLEIGSALQVRNGALTLAQSGPYTQKFVKAIGADGLPVYGQPALSDLSNLAASSLLGNPTGAPATMQGVTLGATLGFSGTVLRTLAGTGDVTWSVNSYVTTIANNAVTNAKAADMAAKTMKGNNTAGTADPADLTVTQVAALLSNPIVTASIAVDFNAANTDFAIPVPAHLNRYWVAFCIVSNEGTTASLTTARGGLFTATGGGGIALSADQALSGITSKTDDANNSLMRASAAPVARLTRGGTPNLYWRTSTAQGAAATGTVTVAFMPLG